MEPEQIRQSNAYYRQQQAPRREFRNAYREALTTGTLKLETVDTLLDLLYEPFPARMKNTPVDPFEPSLPGKDEGNGLGSAVVRTDRWINLHISKKLWHQQPTGVLLRPINDEVRRAGEAIIVGVTPRSEDVEASVMPAYHYKLKVVPTPVWLAWFVGDNGYPTFDE